MSEPAPTKTALLLLEDGTLFQGKPLGVSGTVVGEATFNTGMMGYQEVLTDPSNAGLVIVFNNTYVGGIGTLEEDAESDGVKVNGLICKNVSEMYSRKMADSSLQEYLVKNKAVGISDIDTRALVLHLRDHGVMKCIISSEGLSKEELAKRLKESPALEGEELASTVSTQEAYELGDANSNIKIAVLDLGVKKKILSALVDEGAFLKVFPAKASFSSMKDFGADGYFLSDGPGDPEATDYAVQTIQEMQKTGKPVFGICLGHNLLARANGARNYKLKSAHRGGNQPVLNKITNKSEITAQNHGFTIDPKSIEGTDIEVTHIDLNDEGIEGIRVKGTKASSVQYYPASTPGPHDSYYLLEDFIRLVKESK